MPDLSGYESRQFVEYHGGLDLPKLHQYAKAHDHSVDFEPASLECVHRLFDSDQTQTEYHDWLCLIAYT